MQAVDAWSFLEKKKKILIARGKKVADYSPSPENKEEILKNSLGRSGTLRAPTLCIGNACYVGFNVDMYAGILGK